MCGHLWAKEIQRKKRSRNESWNCTHLKCYTNTNIEGWYMYVHLKYMLIEFNRYVIIKQIVYFLLLPTEIYWSIRFASQLHRKRDGTKNINIIKINKKKETKSDKSDSVVGRTMNHQFRFVMNHPSATYRLLLACTSPLFPPLLTRHSTLWQLYLLRCIAKLCFVFQSIAINLFL